MTLESTSEVIGAEVKKILTAGLKIVEENPELANGLRHGDFCCGCGNQSQCGFDKEHTASENRLEDLLENENAMRVINWYRGDSEL